MNQLLDHALALLLAVPGLAAIGVLLPWVKPFRVAFAGVAVMLGLTCYGWVSSHSLPLYFEFIERMPWIPTWGIQMMIGADALTWPMLVVAEVGLLLALCSARRAPPPRLRGFVACLMAFAACLVGAFVALDTLLLVAFWDASLLFLYFLLGAWGNRQQAGVALKATFYGLLGSLFLTSVCLYLGTSLSASSSGRFDWLHWQQLLSTRGLHAQDLTLSLMVILACASRVPIVPLHTWFIDVIGEARWACRILVVVSVQLGIYTFIRFVLQLLPSSAVELLPGVAWVGVVTFLYSCMLLVVQTDIHRIACCLIMSQVGIVVFGLGSASALSVSGALLHSVSAFTVLSLMVFAVGAIDDRGLLNVRHDLKLLPQRAPRFAFVLLVCAASLLFVPGLSGFMSELMIVLGRWYDVDMLASSHTPTQVFLWTLIMTTGIFVWECSKFLRSLWANRRLASPHDMDVFDILLYVTCIATLISFNFYSMPVVEHFHRLGASLTEPYGYFLGP